jgi:peptidoglycan hydrolase-like protein with peptidoglycan-binding domain
MAYVYVQIDGQRVEDNVAAAFYRLAEAFKAKFGLTLHVRSGTRTRAEQEYLYHLYVTGQGSLAAKPGTSNHEENGPIGPRALDVYDSGSDPGVTRFGTVRANWLRANAPAFGFNPAGYTFSQVEPWHIEYTGSLTEVVGVPAGSTGEWSTTRIQEFLVSLGFDTGGVDGEYGPRTTESTRTYQAWIGLEPDGVFGPKSTERAKLILAGGNRSGRAVSEIQRFLEEKRKIGVGGVDNVWGVKTSFGTMIYQTQMGLTPDALWGPQTDETAFPPAPEPAFPTNGYNAIPGKRSTTEIQTELIRRGYDLGISGADGHYGPVTSGAVARFQSENNLTVDGTYGDQTDAKMFPVVTPPPIETGTEPEHTPSIVDLTADDFPGWIHYEEVFDQQYLAARDWNTGLAKYYGVEYDPIEGHIHWWGLPGQAGTHDGNRDYLNATKDVGANLVISAGRVTKTMPLQKIALTTGRRNPYAWKAECDPLITTEQGDLGYRTLGFVVFKIEQKNPRLAGEALRLHKEFYATQCSNFVPAKIREYAEKFRTGALDPVTGLPPVTTEPDPGPVDPMPGVKQALEAIVALAEDALDELTTEE